jgi:ribonuclease D
MQISLVQERTALAELCEHFASSRWIALDTEFTRESTYYAKLGLLQLATEDTVVCIDPLAVDLLPVLDLLYQPTIIKVLHSGRQDLEVLYDLRRDIPRPLFDTQIAAALLGHPAQIGYAALVESITGVKLAKLHTRTNWEARPLSAEQLHYAGDDVRYLRDVYHELDKQLRNHGRLDWLTQECQTLADPALYRNDPETAYLRLNPGHAVAAAAQPLLKALAAWRERTAQARDRPRGWIAPDAALIEIARAMPSDREALGRLPQTSAAIVRTHGDALLDLVRAARAAPAERLWADARPTTSAEQDLARRMLARVSAVAQKENIRPEVIATRRAVHALMRDRSGALTKGWRRELIGAELIAMAEGDAGRA